jgi:hypothetical protein
VICYDGGTNSSKSRPEKVSRRHAGRIRALREAVEIGWAQSQRGECIDGQVVFREAKKRLAEKLKGC